MSGPVQPGSAVVLCPMEIERKAVARAVAQAALPGVEVFRTGIGAAAIVRLAEHVAAQNPRPGLVLLAGACGGLTATPDVPSIARIIDQHAGEWHAFVGAQPGGVTLISVDDVVSSPEEKRALAARTGAAIVDMESHAFAAACERLRLTWGVVRGVSDTPEESLPREVLRWIGPDGRPRPARAVWDMTLRPRLCAAIVPVLRRSRRVLPLVGWRVVETIRTWRQGGQSMCAIAPISPIPLAGPAPAVLLLCGGTFDPPHRAHVELALRVRSALAATAGAAGQSIGLVYVPAARSPHKAAGALASDADRIAMLRLALAEVPAACIWTDELDRADPDDGSYTIDTIRRARSWLDGQGMTRVRLRWLIGSDQAAQFHRWREPRAIITLAEPCVVLREPLATREALAAALRATGFWSPEEVAEWMSRVVEAPTIDVSATAIRAALAGGGDPVGMLNPAVAAYIHEHALYR